MSGLPTTLAKSDLKHLLDKLPAGGSCSVPALPSSAQAYLAWALWQATGRPWVWVVDGPKSLETFFRDAEAIGADRESHLQVFPAYGPLPAAGAPADPHLLGQRFRCLWQCRQAAGPSVVLTCVPALLTPTLPPHEFDAATFTLALGTKLEPESLAQRLTQLGYEFAPEVQSKRHAARRGGVLDFWPPTEPWPIRAEFFGDTIDSLRTFDPADQTSREPLGSVIVTPAREDPEARPRRALADLADYLPPSATWVWCMPERLRESAELFEETLSEAGRASPRLRWAAFQAKVRRRFQGGQLVVGPEREPDVPLAFRPNEGLPAYVRQESPPFAPDVLEKARRELVRDLARAARDEGAQVHVFFDAPGGRDRFLEAFQQEPGLDRLQLHVAPLSEGFVYEPLRLRVVAESDLFGTRKERLARADPFAPRRALPKAAPLDAWTDLQPGDLVVHADHGIGKYLGLYQITSDGRPQEVLAIEYRDRARLYVPVSQVHLLSKYVGVGRRRPDLHALGGRRWLREKAAAERAVQDLAASLLEVQAAREALPGHAFAPDTPWQHEFEAAFPYEETEDQRRAIEEVKRDMESPRPMDRLVCGDVGYGKTEVAMRAAFKAVMDGRQVAVLVPTTVLAQQHYDTFTDRMAPFPITIEMLSRFRPRSEQADVVRRLREGAVDIVIGTHRLLQPDVGFRDLGLVIIDEEQRFGVRHKEHFKQLRRLVDVLTLTATPIPRTLYLSLTGARDMSTIQTAPQDRRPIQTIVTEYSDELVRSAILRELSRNGQVFYLHNRVQTIYQVARRLTALVPEARMGVAHGQMEPRRLADVMRRFVRGELDVLLCTTIIESGVDIPNVNTIIIDRADRFGMADLYQLRGRVGRYKHQAYAYLLLPRHARLFGTARRRLSAIQRYSSLGAGFKLALRDLEIRGAGNLLGREQSGHIAAIGFDLYCQLLRRTIAQLKGEPVPAIVDVPVKVDFLDFSPHSSQAPRAAALPYPYVEDENHRLQIYRKLAQCTSMADVDRLRDELRDRFGPVPPPAERLLVLARLRIAAARRGIRSVEVREGKVLLTRGGDYVTRQGRFPRLAAADPDARLEELLRLIETA